MRLDYIDNTDALEGLRALPAGSVDLVLTDPPYNIGLRSVKNCKTVAHDWDKIDNYIDWCIEWLTECTRVLKPNGVLYLWHNDIVQITQLLEAIKQRTDLEFVSFCIWDKREGYRLQSWGNRDPDGATALRSWFNTCEYCLHFFHAPKAADSAWKHTGLDRINSNPECYKPLKDWYASELQRLGLTSQDIAAKYTEATGRKPYMLRHYFRDSQFEIPTQKVWETVYEPLGFSKTYKDLREGYEALRAEYEDLRQGYEALRNYHRCDPMHSNVWSVPAVPSTGRLHPCQKPLDILQRIARVSCPPGGVILDPFMGSGSTAVAALREGRHFIGYELDTNYHATALERIASEREALTP